MEVRTGTGGAGAMRILIACIALALCTDAFAARRALLVGINDYSASQWRPHAAPEREWPNLSGAVNDARAMQELLVLLYDFHQRDVTLLIDQAATRAAILQSLERLAGAAKNGDVILFYYAGHGSRVRNTRSEELDQLDESLVPADSRAGARDIRDKELRAIFNRILDRGARLTIILDSCHSGSGARGSGVTRGVRIDPRDVADPANGPRPEDRGALVISATQDDDLAWETRDAQGMMHGAFSWAWIRAICEAAPNEPAIETFLRAQARLRAETPFQDPVIAGDASARQTPFLGGRVHPRRDVVAIEQVRNGTVLLQGGWANGLTIGSELESPRGVRLRVTALHGIARAEARIVAGTPRAGELLEIGDERVRRVHAWKTIVPPAEPPYRLEIRDRARNPVEHLIGGERYEIRLVPRGEVPQRRYFYVFVIDAEGRGVLLFPRGGSVENRFPIGAAEEIALTRFDAGPPFGFDTFFLLATEEPLPNPWILEWDRAGTRSPQNALGRLGTGWSLERRVIPSARARR